ncbi:MAG TPA: choice-of-anchor P family protein [Candidatus Sulfotelmatobacter sp.]
MAARADELSVVNASPFSYYADANVFEARVTQPIRLNTDDVNYVKIERDPGHILHPAALLSAKQKYFSYSSAFSELSAQYDAANEGYRTTATGTVTDLNILNVVTADKVVGQLSTFYPEGNAVPSVTFAGTQFVNLRINGQPLALNENLGIFGAKPAGDGSYFDDAAVLSAISAQYYAIVNDPALPASVKSEYTWSPAAANSMNALECSLIDGVSASTGAAFGNVIVVPGFGQIFLAEVELGRTPDPNSPDSCDYMFRLEMIRVELQGLGSGRVKIIALDTNGQGSGGGGGPKPTHPPKKPKQPAQ